MTVIIEGEKEFYDAIDRLVKSVKPDKIEPVTFKAAQMVTRASRKEAPVGPTGNLKKSVRTKRLRRFGSTPAPSISAINRKKAPHAHLVHDGTGERIAKRGRYRGRRFGRMTAQPFHRKAWNETKGNVLGYIEKEVKKLIDGAVK